MTYINQHGVAVHQTHSGVHFGGVRYEVPLVCQGCGHFDEGEYGDYGSLLSGPSCEKYLIFPTRKGACALHTKPKGRRAPDRKARLCAECGNAFHPEPDWDGDCPTCVGDRALSVIGEAKWRIWEAAQP